MVGYPRSRCQGDAPNSQEIAMTRQTITARRAMSGVLRRKNPRQSCVRKHSARRLDKTAARLMNPPMIARMEQVTGVPCESDLLTRGGRDHSVQRRRREPKPACRSVTAGATRYVNNSVILDRLTLPKRDSRNLYRLDSIDYSFASLFPRRLQCRLRIGPIPTCRAHYRNTDGSGCTS